MARNKVAKCDPPHGASPGRTAKEGVQKLPAIVSERLVVREQHERVGLVRQPVALQDQVLND